MPHRIIDNDEDLSVLGTLLHGLKKPFTVHWVQGRDRSKDQNALQFLWANEVASQLGDRTINEVRQDWKLRHGVPILRAENEAWAAVYNEILKPMSYEMKVKVMAIIPVTSEMTVKQMRQYLDTVQRECLQQGLRLTDPDPMLLSKQSV